MGIFWRKFRKNYVAVLGFTIILIIILTALFAQWIAPFDPYEMNPDRMLEPPGKTYWFGTDQFGRDIFSRVLYGSQISLKVGFISVGLSLVVGTVVVVVAGYYGKWIDAILSRITDVLFSFPDILLALVIMAILGPSLTNLMIAIGIVYTPTFARVTRGAVLEIRESLYIEAAES